MDGRRRIVLRLGCGDLIRALYSFNPLYSCALILLCPCPFSRLNNLRTMEPILSVVEGNYKLVAVLFYPAQFNKMLKYKNVEFLQIFAKKRALLFTFVKFLLCFGTFLHPFLTFFSCPFCLIHPCFQSTSVCRPKTNIPNRRTKKKRNFPTILNFKKFHFSIMLICVILSNAISTGTKNRAFVLRQLKLADAPWRARQIQYAF